jgi:hypothetical protein
MYWIFSGNRFELACNVFPLSMLLTLQLYDGSACKDAVSHYQKLRGGTQAAQLLLADSLLHAHGHAGYSGGGDGLGPLDQVDQSTGGPRQAPHGLVAWAPCKCQAKGFESGGKLARKLKRAQDVLWAVPRAAADALFSTTQEYLDRGCAASPWRDDPPPRWMKSGCQMHVDGRDHYECMFVLRLARFNIGYEVGSTSATRLVKTHNPRLFIIYRKSSCGKESVSPQTCALREEDLIYSFLQGTVRRGFVFMWSCAWF